MTLPHTVAIRQKVLAWYTKYKRSLPWRETSDPYHILVSEVMLQQTQVSRVIDKYTSFLNEFPTLQHLANASPARIIMAWQGLGYNRRALFLQKTAQAVLREHEGVFPSTLESLTALPGVGDYTARAILAFSFRIAVPMMDTNHRRFYSRVFFGMQHIRDKELLHTAEHILPPNAAYDFNQALMDFGSAICTTKNPKCIQCPLQVYCTAYPHILTHTVANVGKKKKHIPFRDTDRYIRGRIIDYLRMHNTESISTVRELFPDIDEHRFLAVVQGLIRDGLLCRNLDILSLPM